MLCISIFESVLKENGSKQSKKCIFLVFADFSSKSDNRIKQMSLPPFWGDVGVKKWSRFLNTDTQSPIFGHLNMGTFGQNCKGGSSKTPPFGAIPHFWLQIQLSIVPPQGGSFTIHSLQIWFSIVIHQLHQESSFLTPRFGALSLKSAHLSMQYCTGLDKRYPIMSHNPRTPLDTTFAMVHLNLCISQIIMPYFCIF